MDRPTQTSRYPVSGRILPVAVRRFLDTEAAGGIVLVAAAVAAVVWANSPWQASYESVWHTEVTLKVGTVGISEDLQHFVNDGLMSLFFVVVALEIKRELVAGDLRDLRVAALPFVAAGGAWLSRPRSTWHSTPLMRVLTDGAFPWPPTSLSPLVCSLFWDDACRRASRCSC